MNAHGAMAEVHVVFGDIESNAQAYQGSTPAWVRSDSDDFRPVKRPKNR